jgi:hypothetical protein
MFKFKPLLAFAAALLLATLACTQSGTPAPDPNFVNTAVAQTLVAIQTGGAPSVTPLVPTSTFTPDPPTITPTTTLSPTPVFTVTPSVPLISVSVATNCRVGPGRIYDRVGALLVGETAEVIGRNPAGNYWYIANPDVRDGFCWLWGEYATLSGNTQALPVFTPPPTPTPAPAFSASYSGLESCNNTWWVEFRLENTGGLTFRSMLLAVADPSTNTTVSSTDNSFTNLNGCSGSDSRNVLVPGEKFVVSAPAFAYDPTGHKLRATITLCSEDGVNGTCLTRVVEFTP